MSAKLATVLLFNVFVLFTFDQNNDVYLTKTIRPIHIFVSVLFLSSCISGRNITTVSLLGHGH